MPTHLRKITQIEFALGTPPVQFECQVQTWTIANNTGEAERLFFQCPTGEVLQDADDEYALEVTFAADWRLNGIGDFLVDHDKELAAFTLVHHPGVVDEETTWTGTCKLRAPSVGGEARTNEMLELTFPIVGKPVYARTNDGSSPA